jgi:hypothetical protein
MAVATVLPLHSMIREALERLRQARADGDPDHNPQRCSGACVICTNQRHLNRLLDRVQRKVQ